MAFFDRLVAWRRPTAAPRASDAGVQISTMQELEAALKGEGVSNSGVPVTPDTAMREAVTYRSVGLISGAVATMPLDLKRRVDKKTREDADDHPLWSVLKRKPNRWQKPAQFRRMMEAQKQLRGNAFALKVRSPLGKKQVTELIPFRPGSIQVKQRDDLLLEYHYTAKDGSRRVFAQEDVFHLMGLTLDGITGVSPITYARESIGASLSMEKHGANVFKNGAQVGGVLSHPSTLGPDGQTNLRASLDAYRSNGDKAGAALILEEGMKFENITMSSTDAQWIESRKFTRTDIAMFFGVPPHMLGDTEKSTSWGTGMEQQTQGFITFSLEDHLTTWEESINADLIDEPDIYAKFNRAALVRGDLKARWEAYVKSLQWGVNSPNEVRALEDDNPREGGDVYYDPPNTAGESEGTRDEPETVS